MQIFFVGTNAFISFPIVSAGAVGLQAPIDLFGLVPLTGMDEELTFICKGDFKGTISIEGSPDGVVYDVLGQFDAGVDADALSGPALEFSPLRIRSAVRFLRLKVFGVVNAATKVTVAAEQNCDCGEAPPVEIFDLLQFSGNSEFQSPA